MPIIPYITLIMRYIFSRPKPGAATRFRPLSLYLRHYKFPQRLTREIIGGTFMSDKVGDRTPDLIWDAIGEARRAELINIKIEEIVERY
jgi:hypothetical protein